MARGTVRCKAPAPAEIEIADVPAMKKAATSSLPTTVKKTKSPAPAQLASEQSAIAFKTRSTSKASRRSSTPSPRSVINQCPPSTKLSSIASKLAKDSKAPKAKRPKAVSTKPKTPKAPKVSKVSKTPKVPKVSPSASKISKISTVTRTCLSRVCNREGIVWAKLCGFPHWPARIISDKERLEEATFREADESKRAADDTLVYFFGTRNVAWVARDKAVRMWKSGIRKKFHSRVTRDKKEFRKAMTEVRKYCRGKSQQLVL